MLSVNESSFFDNRPSGFAKEDGLPLVDLTHLEWKANVGTGTTGGTYYKAVDFVDGIKKFYKLSLMTGDTVIGHESLNEVIISRLLRILGLPHVDYRLLNAVICVAGTKYTTQLCVSDNFVSDGYSEVSLAQFIGSKDNFDCLRRLQDKGFSRAVDQMLLVDFLMANRDRHSSNIEFLVSGNCAVMAPLFDNGFSLVAPFTNNWEVISVFDAMKDMPVNNALGFSSLYANLDLITQPVIVNPLKAYHRAELVADLNKFAPSILFDKILEMIYGRYDYAKAKKVLVEKAGV